MLLSSELSLGARRQTLKHLLSASFFLLSVICSGRQEGATLWAVPLVRARASDLSVSLEGEQRVDVCVCVCLRVCVLACVRAQQLLPNNARIHARNSPKARTLETRPSVFPPSVPPVSGRSRQIPIAEPTEHLYLRSRLRGHRDRPDSKKQGWLSGPITEGSGTIRDPEKAGNFSNINFSTPSRSGPQGPGESL